jgi:tetratricopeptide (TPR) repeat protein
MRTCLEVILALGLAFMAGNSVRAGLYNTKEPRPGPEVSTDGVKPMPSKKFQDAFIGVRQIAVAGLPGNTAHEHYLAARDELLRKARAGTLTVEERVDLSEYLIRLRQYEEAVELLESIAAQERWNFRLAANLATAHQLAGRLDRALSYLQQALDAWPAEVPGWIPGQVAWYRRAEQFQLKLVRLRLREQASAAGGRSKPPETLDDLFSPRDQKAPFRFVGESGTYEAGKLAAAERSKLPEDALALVQQLVLWLPDDTRLYWLLGELYNADGDLETALRIFDDCVWNRRYDSAELKAHRQIVADAKAKAQPTVLLPSAAPEPEQPAGWTPEPRQIITVTTVAGLVIAGLVYLQVRELRKRSRKGRQHEEGAGR